jgi:hypothetical protein
MLPLLMMLLPPLPLMLVDVSDEWMNEWSSTLCSQKILLSLTGGRLDRREMLSFRCHFPSPWPFLPSLSVLDPRFGFF